MSGSKNVWGFFIMFILKGITTFNVKESMLNKNLIKTVDKNETESKIENPAHTLKGMNHVLAHIRITN